MSGRGRHEHPAGVDRQVAREAVDPGAQLQPALPGRHPDGAPAARRRRQLRGEARHGRGGRRARLPRRRGRVPVPGPPEPVHVPGRRREDAGLRVERPAVDRARGPAGVPWRPGPRAERVAHLRRRRHRRRATPDEPGDARRRVPGAALVVGGTAGPDRGCRARPRQDPAARGVLGARQPAVAGLPRPTGPDPAPPAVVELAHPVDEAAVSRAGRRSVDRARRRRAGPRLVGAPEELGEAAVRLEVAPDHHRVVRLERLRHPVDERPRKAEGVADLPHRAPRPVGHEVADHPRVLGAVALVDVLDDLLAALRAEVDVDVRVGGAALVDEALEEEVVADRVDPGDPQHVGHDRVGGAAAPLGRDPALLREAHEVPADEEELGEAGPLDDVELVGQLLHDRRRHGVVAPPDAPVAELGEVREGRLAGRHGEAREAVLLEAEVDPAGRRQLARVRDPLAPGGRRGRVGASRRPAAARPARRPTSGGARRWGSAARRASRPSARGGSRSGRRAARDPPGARSGRRS